MSSKTVLIKIVEHKVSSKECLDSTVLAVWFLDDGGRSSGVNTGVFLTVDNYTQNEIECIQQTLKNVFGITARCHVSGKTLQGLIQKRLSITGENYKIFYKIVSPLILEIPSMSSKKLIKV